MNKKHKLDYPIIELGEPVLRQQASKVSDPTSNEVKALVNGMLDSLAQAQGVGLAAPQVGVSKRLFLVSPSGEQRAPYTHIDDTLVVINPSIKALSKKTAYDWEGCLSIPGFRAQVKRYKDIELSYTNLLGETCIEQYSDFTARIIQHEFDHLEGIVFLDRLKDLSTLMTDGYFMKRLEEAESQNQNHE